MSRAPFEPVGEKAQWRYAYELVEAAAPGDVIMYAELAEALDIGIDPLTQAGRDKLNGIMNAARKHLELDGLPTVSTVERYGWKVLTAQENLDEIARRRVKAARQVDRTARVLNATPRDQLDQLGRARYDAEVRSVTAAGALFSRKTRSFQELTGGSKPRELPQRRIPGTEETA